jgi:hypothetical protein
MNFITFKRNLIKLIGRSSPFNRLIDASEFNPTTTISPFCLQK